LRPIKDWTFIKLMSNQYSRMRTCVK
jgi:hypothetical protein